MGWKAREAMALLLSVNQLSLPPCERTDPGMLKLQAARELSQLQQEGPGGVKNTTVNSVLSSTTYKQ